MDVTEKTIDNQGHSFESNTAKIEAASASTQKPLKMPAFRTPENAIPQTLHNRPESIQIQNTAISICQATKRPYGTPDGSGRHSGNEAIRISDDASGSERARRKARLARFVSDADLHLSKFNNKEVNWWGDVVNSLREIGCRKQNLEKVGSELRRFRKQKLARKLEDCSSFVWYRHWIEQKETDFKGANFCQQTKLCRNCAFFSSLKTSSKFADMTQGLLDENPDLIPMMMTFTVRNGKQLLRTLDNLTSGLRAVRQRIRDSKRYRFSEWSKMQAAAIHIEIKRGKNSGQWHPHAHAMVLREKSHMFNLSNMQSEWNKLVGGGNINLVLTKTAKLMLKHKQPASIFSKQLSRDCMEVFKYITKFSETTPGDLVHIYLHTQRKRFFYAWGKYYGMKLEPASACDFDREGSFFDIHCRRVGDSYHLVRGSNAWLKSA